MCHKGSGERLYLSGGEWIPFPVRQSESSYRNGITWPEFIRCTGDWLDAGEVWTDLDTGERWRVLEDGDSEQVNV